MRRALATFLAAAAPSLAAACPVCARESAPGAWMVIAGLVAAPYLVALGVARAVRRAGRGSEP